MGCGDIGRAVGGVTDAIGITNYSGDRALDAQRRAAGDANQTMWNMYQQQRQDMEPWRAAGAGALTGLQGDFMKDWKKDPAYQFQLNEGNKAINAAASARGLGNSGATLKALTKYGQDYANTAYDQAYNRQYNRLSSLAGLGSNAASTNASNAGQYGQGVAANYIGLGNAQAANQMAASGRMANLLNNGITAAATYFSDLRLKTDIKSIPKADLDEMKSHLKAYSYSYKNKKHGDGEWIGVMAQDLEKSKLGKTLVIENEAGEKMIDVNKVLSLFLATMAEG